MYLLWPYRFLVPNGLALIRWAVYALKLQFQQEIYNRNPAFSFYSLAKSVEAAC
jgi:hypothetical protein